MSLQNNTQTFTLNNGVVVPAVGLGTWQLAKEGEGYNSTLWALKAGYKHIDTAAIYKNEEEVGRGIKDSGVPRDQIFVTTKLWNSDHKNAEEAFNTSLKKLGLDYIDLYLIHWPVSTDPATNAPYPDYDFVDTYKAIQKIYKRGDGRLKAIGVSNFSIEQIQRLLDDSEIDVVPAVNQIEAHPLLPQPKLKAFLDKHNILVTAFSPLGSTGAPVANNSTVIDIAKKHDVEPAQVLISWAVQRNTIVIPKSVSESRIISNRKTIVLSDDEFAALNGLAAKEGVKRIAIPPFYLFPSNE